MTRPFDPGALVRDARRRAGLSQRALAARAGTSQSVVARVAGNLSDPSGETLRRLLAAAGVEIRCELAPVPVADTHMLADVERILALTPEERLLEVRNFTLLLDGARRV